MNGNVAATYLRTFNKEPYMPIWLQDLVAYTLLVVSFWSLYNHDYPDYP